MTTLTQFLREKGISFQTEDGFNDWLVDTTEAEVVAAVKEYMESGIQMIKVIIE